MNTVIRNRIARINTDGSLDGGFDPNASFPVNGLALQADGKVLVCGDFNTIGGVYGDHRRLARLTNNIAATQSISVTGTSRIDWVRGGSTPEVEQARFEIWQAGQSGNMEWSDLGPADPRGRGMANDRVEPAG